MKKTDKQLNSKNGRKKAKLTPVPKTKYKKFQTNFDDDEDDFNFKAEKYQQDIEEEDFDEEDDFDEEYDDEEYDDEAVQDSKNGLIQINLEDIFKKEDNA